ncbi:sterol desaturase family protein [Chitinimonas sp.]|uniref:sterol desaturase family protein n=1 Tax=Chitinimonas sp. TaxID=1934313 RepID=UPI002F936E18
MPTLATLRWLPLLLLLAVALEWAWLRRYQPTRLDTRESLASLGVAVGHRLTQLASGGLLAGLYGWVWSHRIATVPLGSVWAWLALFVASEFCYYWQHRLGHECRWFWASHSVHHSSNHFNFAAAYRLSWTAALTGGALCFLPLIWLGFAPGALLAVLALNLLYQFWLHTEVVPKLGWLEWLLNTPSHHRVHHAANPHYLDANYGGVLIVFDRLFGTFVAETAAEPCRYGLVRPLNTYNPLRIVFAEWLELVRDLYRARGWCDRLGHLLRAPGWQPGGAGQTSRDLKRQAMNLLPNAQRNTP